VRTQRRGFLFGLVVASLAAPPAQAGIVFKFSPTNPKAGTELVFVQPIRAQPPPAGAARAPAGSRGVELPDDATAADLYLVRNGDAPTVTNRSDPRLIPLGYFDWTGSTLRCCPPDTSFPIPVDELPRGDYALAAWCLDCTGRRFYVIGVGTASAGDAPLQLLHIRPADGTPYWPFLVAAAALVVAGGALAWIRGTQRRRPDAATDVPTRRDDRYDATYFSDHMRH
jgi:hypothetical protein